MNATEIESKARDARAAAGRIATVSTEVKDACLLDLAGRLDEHVDSILAANALDMRDAESSGVGDAKLRRLKLTEESVHQIADGLRQVVSLPDPVGQVTRDQTVPSGLRVRKVRCPLGVIMMIYEARPSVTVDAFALCFKAGNACILKGGREARRSNEVLADLAAQSLEAHDLPRDALTLLTTSDRDAIKHLLTLEQYIDLVIPRGGEALIRFVHEHSRIPTVQHFHGVCHIFVDESADLDRAIEICVTAKTSAPATCNAVEAILIHQNIADAFVPKLVERFVQEGVEVRGGEPVRNHASQVVPATEDDWGKEFLDLIVAIAIVADLQAAVAHIQRYSSGHTDAILTRDPENARLFTERVQSSCTLVNASTRFNDGFQLGLGAEIGISTSKIHAYGPMGLEELTTQRYVVFGDGHAR